MKLKQFIGTVEKAHVRFKTMLHVRLDPVLHSIMGQLRERSPIDKGMFRSQWRITKRGLSGGGVRYMISNPTIYGTFLDEGAEPGNAPWFWPNENNAGTISKSGKLTARSSINTSVRVWAGGKSPSGFVVGGIIDPILMVGEYRTAAQNQDSIVEAVATAAMETFG